MDPSSPLPLAGQIAAGVRGALIRGEVSPGERLPSARALGESLGVNLHTVLRAYAELREQGVIELRRGRGAVVRRGVEAEHVSLRELARTVVVEARRLGVDPAALIAEATA